MERFTGHIPGKERPRPAICRLSLPKIDRASDRDDPNHQASRDPEPNRLIVVAHGGAAAREGGRGMPRRPIERRAGNQKVVDRKWRSAPGYAISRAWRLILRQERSSD